MTHTLKKANQNNTLLPNKRSHLNSISENLFILPKEKILLNKNSSRTTGRNKVKTMVVEETISNIWRQCSK